MFLKTYVFLCSLAIGLLVVNLSVYSQNNQTTSIIINIPSRTLELYAGNSLVQEYQIAVGTPATPSPIGSYKIFYKEVNPTWFPPEKPGTVKKPAVPPGPDNPLGYRWMEFLATYGIHDTNAPWSIGTAASNGCIRMHEVDVEKLYEVVEIGTPVLLTYERVKLRADLNGRYVLTLYPDIYNLKRIQLQDIKEKLRRNQV